MNNHIRLSLRFQAALICSRLNAEKSIADYIKDLIRLDMDDSSLLRYEHSNTKPLSDFTLPVNTTLRLYYDTDQDIIQHLSGIEHPLRYIRELIYWDMGINPEDSHLLKRSSRERVRTLITPEEIADIRSTLGMTRKEFAHTIGVSARTIEAWELGETIPPTPAQKIFVLLKDNPALAEKIS